MRPDQWTMMSVDGASFTLSVRVNDIGAAFVFSRDDLDLLKRHVDAAVANRKAARRRKG